MNNNSINKFLIVLLLIFLCINGYLIVHKLHVEKLLENMIMLVNYKDKLVNNLKIDIQNFNKHLLLQIENEGFRLDTELKNKVRIENNSLLIFRFHDGNCIPCVNNQLLLLKRYALKFHKENEILIISGYANRNSFNEFINDFNEISVINLPQGKLPLDDSYKPYFFSLDNNYYMRRIFIPNESDSSLTINYFNINNKIIR